MACRMKRFDRAVNDVNSERSAQLLAATSIFPDRCWRFSDKSYTLIRRRWKFSSEQAAEKIVMSV